VLSLADDLTPWSVAEAGRELDRIVERDGRLAFAPTAVLLLLGRVADYYAAAVEVPVPTHQPSAPTDRKPGPVLVRQPGPAPVQRPPADTAAPPAVIDDPQPGPGPLELAPGHVGSEQEPVVEIRPAQVFTELPLQPSATEDQSRTVVARIQGDDGGRHGNAAEGPGSSRLLFGVHAADTLDPITVPSGSRSRTFVGIGAAVLLIVALGGYAAFRPAAVTTPAVRQASAPPSTAGPDAASPTTAPTSAPASLPDAEAAPPTPGAGAALAPAAGPERPAPSGTIEVLSPLPLTVSEDGRALGTSGEPIQVPAGRHTLTIGREDLGYRAVQVVDVKPGRPHRIELPLPSGFANLNATPWAEVWIDGRKIGETPLGRVQLTIGPHEVQFRHPELGDQTRTLTVTTGTVALLSVELKK
jgi:eukaryotic-like serine/threonine-protein kinase